MREDDLLNVSGSKIKIFTKYRKVIVNDTSNQKYPQQQIPKNTETDLTSEDLDNYY